MDARRVHGDRYDYSLFSYVGNKIRGKIICPIHGVFEQTPTRHLSGNRCKKCSPKLYTQDQFVELARAIHGQTYDYGMTVYKNSQTHIKITCRTHGTFEQKPNKHLQGRGCPTCGRNILSNDEFVSKVTTLHQNRYSYECCQYNGYDNYIIITCRVHGNFKQVAGTHLKGMGCKKCAVDAQKSDTEAFIKSATQIHGVRYDYSKTTYTTSKASVAIVCSIHGLFFQTACIHLSGSGCSQCVHRVFPSMCAFIYVLKMQNEEEAFYKVGITKHKDGRFPKYKFRGYHIQKIASYKTTWDRAKELEKKILAAMTPHTPRVLFTGSTECITTNPMGRFNLATLLS
jgi:hypothetical protein